jgi:hypothetical protein
VNFRLSSHAREELGRRQIPEALLDSVLRHPEQIVGGYAGARVYQSQLDFADGKKYLLRAVVNESVDPAVVVTVYRTSKIAKYWRSS